tara:strand:- start:1597 stop:2136 length:540 start_codon:yes stop_codon:yes gene_type:complete
MNFIDTYKVDVNLCDKLIKYWKNNKEYKHEGSFGSEQVNKTIKNSTDVIFFNSSKDIYIKEFFKKLSTCVTQYCSKYKIDTLVNTSLANKIQYYSKGGGYKVYHYERDHLKNSSRQLVYMLYLNTVKDKGGTKFLNQKITTPAIKGDLIIWPAEFTHIHKGIVSPSEEKYIATGWFDLI